jgi:hypothetical protein
MTNRLLILLALLLAVIFFALGRYTSKTITTTTDKKVDEVKDTNTQKHEVITEVKKPDGTVTTVTVIDSARSTQDHKDSDTLTKTTITTDKPKYNVSLLAATTIHEPFGPPSYGISVSKEFIGLRVGAFGLMNGTIGLSVGVDF